MASIRPLRVEELAEILAIQFDEEVLPIFNTIGLQYTQKKRLCPGGHQVVQFSHFSVKEYLTSERLATVEEPSSSTSMTKSTGLAEHLIAAHSEDVNSEGGCAPLHAAAQSGYREVAELLLGSSASLDDIARLLIDRGADVNAQEEDRWTALHLASSEEHLTTLAFTPSPTLALTLRVVALTAPALTPCVVALAACPHTTPAALASLTGGRRCIRHLVYWPWDAVTLFFVLYHPTAPPPSAYEQPAFCDSPLALHNVRATSTATTSSFKFFVSTPPSLPPPPPLASSPTCQLLSVPTVPPPPFAASPTCQLPSVPTVPPPPLAHVPTPSICPASLYLERECVAPLAPPITATPLPAHDRRSVAIR
ncbi:hypothetical protein BGY98DRAFT_1102336 [Russula aff. rugulosa BPL654]|nr:hypothetical protein BGY98DRAFT_1102336 [Russula aff. rugulosa BPL654]